MWDNHDKVCKIGPVAIKSDTPSFNCGNGYKVRVDSSNARDNYIKTWYTSPLTNGELVSKVPLLSSEPQVCGTGVVPLRCPVNVWQSPVGCV